MKKILITILCITLLIISSACMKEPVKVVFGEAGWDSMKFHNAVAMYIAKNAYDMKTEETSGSTAITYSALKTGDIQIYMETWTDSIATYKKDLTEGSIVELSINYADNKQGFYVPRYVIEGDTKRGIKAVAPDLKTVEDLKKYSNIFTDPDNTSKGRIYGAISGWAVDDVLRKKYVFYGLDKVYNYIDPGSDSALSASIVAAYEKGEPIVAYYWEPAWITGQYDLVLLEDAPYNAATYDNGECECPSMNITVCANSDFYKNYPEFCKFLSNYKTSSAMTSEALSYIQTNDASYEAAVKWFFTEHNELLDQWLPSDKAALVRKALTK